MAFPRYDLNQINNDLKLAIRRHRGRHRMAKIPPRPGARLLAQWLQRRSAAPFVSPDGFQINNGMVTGVKVQRTPFV